MPEFTDETVSEEINARIAEFKKHLSNRDIEVDDLTLIMLAHELARVQHRCGCLHPGGGGVDTWIASRVSQLGLIEVGCCNPDADHSCGTFHFWAWDEAKYGPWEEGKQAEKSSQTARSPTTKLRESKPVNRTTWKVAGTGHPDNQKKNVISPGRLKTRKTKKRAKPK